MKGKWKRNPFLKAAVVLTGLLVLAAVLAVGMFYYLFSIPEPEGISLAQWPNDYTNTFVWWLESPDGQVCVREGGLKQLDEYGLWLQLIDENGQEVFAHNKPAHYPVRYTASELLHMGTEPYENGDTVFAGRYEDGDKTWSYLIGFPYAIGKYVLYYNGETVTRLSPVSRAIGLFCILALVCCVVGYGIWLSRKVSAITDGIRQVSARTYAPLPEQGVFSGIYAVLNKMDQEIRRSDQIQAETDRARNEWIANITHDLKTPLSPIQGYAELLADHLETDRRKIQEYGLIILKNLRHIEKLIQDLKLTYQLDAGAVPYRPQETRLIRYLKELMIDLINDPAFADRQIEFESDVPEQKVLLDPDLFRRAAQNLVINALVHNPPDTAVTISVHTDPGKRVSISILDHGTGMSQAELADLFSRYYRGTSTRARPEGTGLGLAIAKQIVTLHGGEIAVTSAVGRGTAFVIQLPLPEETDPPGQ